MRVECVRLMVVRHALLVTALVAAALAPTLAWAAPARPSPVWVTLGTNSGPILNPRRSEPSNLLRSGDQNILVDVGSGAVEQLNKVGCSLVEVQTVIISHLHFDHTSGLFALLSLRYQAATPGVLIIYGPPGTQATVDALTDAMLPAMESLGAMRPTSGSSPRGTVRVIEIADGAKFTVGNVRVSAAVNTHYSFPTGSPAASRNLSFAYRFDMPGRSIVYTGDTGPSASVERLAKDADLLISEIGVDPEMAAKFLRVQKPDLPPAARAALEDHFRKEHLSPVNAGLMAQRAGVKAVVYTHDPVPAQMTESVRREVAQNYSGPITFANDLDEF